MTWLTQAFSEHSVAWLVITTSMALLAGILSSWLTYRLKRREIIDAAIADIQRQRAIVGIETEGEKQERIRNEIRRWANPILDSVVGLEKRLKNVLDDHGHLALGKNTESAVPRGWSISYDYFMPSTLYYFAQYFCWVRLLQEELNFELFRSQKENDDFFHGLWNVTSALTTWPPADPCDGEDTQVFTLQQRGIGEALIVKDGRYRKCMSYHQFLRSYNNPIMQAHLAPLISLLHELKSDGGCRWNRVQATRAAIVELRKCCEAILQPPAPTNPN
jgi:hypothetical protein